MRSGWDTSKETRHELPRVHRAPVRVLGPRADAAGGAGNPPAPLRLPSVRRALRLRTVVPRLPAGALPRAGRAPRAEAPHPAGAVRRVSWLAPGGLAAALAVGAAVAWGFGWQGLVLLFAFFISGSLLSQLAERRAPRRNARQVLANGGVAAVAALLGAWWLATGAIAAAGRRYLGHRGRRLVAVRAAPHHHRRAGRPRRVGRYYRAWHDWRRGGRGGDRGPGPVGETPGHRPGVSRPHHSRGRRRHAGRFAARRDRAGKVRVPRVRRAVRARE